jgi:hypothetical protein
MIDSFMRFGFGKECAGREEPAPAKASEGAAVMSSATAQANWNREPFEAGTGVIGFRINAL